MRMVKLMAASAAVAALAVGAPAMAQANQNNDVTDSDNGAIVVNDLLDVYLQAQSTTDNRFTADDINSNNNNGNTVAAFQLLNAINTNYQMDELVDLDGQDETSSPVGYHSGDNYVRGSAFAAFAGILNQAWNTGINSNAQAATNIAAQGTINFGDGAAAPAGGGGGGGGED